MWQHEGENGSKEGGEDNGGDGSGWDGSGRVGPCGDDAMVVWMI